MLAERSERAGVEGLILIPGDSQELYGELLLLFWMQTKVSCRQRVRKGGARLITAMMCLRGGVVVMVCENTSSTMLHMLELFEGMNYFFSIQGSERIGLSLASTDAM